MYVFTANVAGTPPAAGWIHPAVVGSEVSGAVENGVRESGCVIAQMGSILPGAVVPVLIVSITCCPTCLQVGNVGGATTRDFATAAATWPFCANTADVAVSTRMRRVTTARRFIESPRDTSDARGQNVSIAVSLAGS